MSAGDPGPFYHGTRHALQPGDLLLAGQPSNYEPGRISNHVYFTATLEAAIWGAELAVALGAAQQPGRIYVVEPTGPFEDDPNVTDKRFPGNPTRSYRSRAPLKVLAVLEGWTGHAPEVVDAMLQSLEALRRQGRALIED